MAITSIGYTGEVDNPEWALYAGKMGSQYGVMDPMDFRPTKSTTTARGVRIGIRTGNAPAVAFGRGVIDTMDAAVEYQLPVVATGQQRWFLIVLDRTWQGTNSTVIANVAGSATKAIPFGAAFFRNPGVRDMQPLALALVVGGQTQVQDLVDLRVWASTGGATAIDTMVTDYLSDPGTCIRVGDTTYTRVLNGNLSAVWNAVKDPASGVRPYLMLGRRAQYGSDSAAGFYKAYGADETSTDGDWSTHFTSVAGTSNTAPAYIVVKTDGLYSINGRFSVGSNSPIQGFLSLEGGWTRITDAQEIRSNPGSCLLNVADTVFIKAGTRVGLTGRFYNAFRVQQWFLWMNRIAD